MREILFRGKRIDNGEWVYGFPFFEYFSDGSVKNAYILAAGYDSVSCFTANVRYSVIPETVGQFTGLTDKNGKKIFEGDVIERRLLPTKRICTKSIVKYAEPHAAFAINDINGNVIEDYLDSILRMNFEIEIIGNIYDNPELLSDAT